MRIDATFRTRVGTDIPALRLVDDIYIGADNLDEAHSLLGEMRECVRLMELDLNDSKTFVLEASKDFEAPWPIQIRESIDRFKDYKKSLVSDFIHTLDDIIAKSISNNDDGIIKYALRKIDNESIWHQYWEPIEPFLIRCCISFPHSWDYVAQIVSKRNYYNPVSTQTWSIVINKSLAQNVKNGHDYEITWALWLAKMLNCAVDQSLSSTIFEKCGSFPMIVSLDLYQKGLFGGKLPKQTILDRIGEKPCMGPLWLFAYEADQKFSLKIKTKNLQGHEFFQVMYNDNVSFYDLEHDLEYESEDDPKSPAIKKSSSYEDIEDESDF